MTNKLINILLAAGVFVAFAPGLVLGNPIEKRAARNT